MRGCQVEAIKAARAAIVIVCASPAILVAFYAFVLISIIKKAVIALTGNGSVRLFDGGPVRGAG